MRRICLLQLCPSVCATHCPRICLLLVFIFPRVLWTHLGVWWFAETVNEFIATMDGAVVVNKFQLEFIFILSCELVIFVSTKTFRRYLQWAMNLSERVKWDMSANIRELTVFETFHLVDFIRFDISNVLHPRDATQVPFLTYTHTRVRPHSSSLSLCVWVDNVKLFNIFFLFI